MSPWGPYAVWKYELTPVCAIRMPDGAELLEVEAQQGLVCLWALVDPDRPMVTRRFRVVGTGHRELNGDEVYIGTAHMTELGLVLHAFEDPSLLAGLGMDAG